MSLTNRGSPPFERGEGWKIFPYSAGGIQFPPIEQENTGNDEEGSRSLSVRTFGQGAGRGFECIYEHLGKKRDVLWTNTREGSRVRQEDDCVKRRNSDV